MSDFVRTEAEVDVRFHIAIPMRDRICLSANLYLPRDAPQPVPTILTMTPYVAQSTHDVALAFARRGFGFAAVDVRGRGNSEGVFWPNLNDGEDGHDLVAWLASQSFCDGRVVMWGGSYAGHAQWMTAAQWPPALEAVCPTATVYPGVDFPMRSNIFYPYVMQYMVYVAGRTMQDGIFEDPAYWREQLYRFFASGRPFEDLDRFLGLPSRIFQEWISHPERSSYWDQYNPTAEQLAGIDCPILTITGLYDSAQLGALTHYRRHLEAAGEGDGAARHFLIIGPWDHGGTRTPKTVFGGLTFDPAGSVDLVDLHAQFYAWAMEAGPRPAFLAKRIAYYVAGAERWRYADTLSEITRAEQTVYLTSSGSAHDVFGSGSLVAAARSSGYDEARFDLSRSAIAEVERIKLDGAGFRPTFGIDDLTDQTQVFARSGEIFVYHSPPFERLVELCGFIKLRLWLSLDQRDVDLRATVYMIDQAGRSILLTTDLKRARYRESAFRESPVTMGEPLEFRFDEFLFTARALPVGSRLRLVLEPISSIFMQRNFGGGGTVSAEKLEDAGITTLRLHHGQDFPSALTLPLGQDLES